MVNSKGISPRQGIYAKLKRMVPFHLYFLCTRGIALFKHHLNEFWESRVLCSSSNSIDRSLPSALVFCVLCQPITKPILLNFNKLWVQASSAIMTVTNIETWKLINLTLLLAHRLGGERGGGGGVAI